MASRQKPTPFTILLPYQRRWVEDDARFKIGMWARQTGKSFACAGEAVANAWAYPKSEWVVLSAGERQALEFMRKAKEWAEAFKFVASEYAEFRDSAEALIKSAEITWPNGSRMVAVPANPDTARGYSANLILDEFGFHEKPDAIWRAIYPSISNPLKGVKKIRIVSTPNGKANKFYDLWTKNQNYSHHTVTIYNARDEGLPINVEELQAGLDDPEGWAQEYECQFIDTAAILLPYELIAQCEHPEASETCAPEFFGASPGQISIGIDFGRKHDLTVAWTLERIGDVQWTREVFCLRNTPTQVQFEHLRPRVAAAQRVSLDYTGSGTGLGDLLVGEFGQYDPDEHKFGKVELCQYTNQLKTDIFPKLRIKFEDRLLRVPVSRAVREDLHSIHRVTTATGQITYRAPHNEDGHADRANALALAVRAATNSGPGMPFHIFSDLPRARQLADRRDRTMAG